MKTRGLLKKVLLATVFAGLLTACTGENKPKDNTSTSDTKATGQIYFLNFKPEQDEAYQKIAKKYAESTGITVKVVTAGAGTYEQQLRSEIAKKDAPTIFQVNGPVGFANWRDYTADLKNSEIYTHLSDKTLAITEGEGVYGIPFAIEGYGIIINNKIMDKYFQLEGAKIKTLDELNNFAILKDVVLDMQSKKEQLGIEGVFASTSLKPGEDWRWQTHMVDVPIYYEFQKNNVDLSNPSSTETIEFKYSDNYKNLFDLYINNSTIEPSLASSKTVNDSMSEFALGQAAMVQNGNWGYGQISAMEGNTVKPEDVTFIPLYMGIEGEDKQGLCIGTENFFCINKKASEADQKASLDFLNWLYASEDGKEFVAKDLGFITPFDTFSTEDLPNDPLVQQLVNWNSRTDIKNVPWVFTVFPSQEFKNNFGSNLLLYTQGQMQWNDVVDKMVKDWKTEKEASK